jgi:hypothetical protein
LIGAVGELPLEGIGWVIVGGESGPKAPSFGAKKKTSAKPAPIKRAVSRASVLRLDGFIGSES